MTDQTVSNSARRKSPSAFRTISEVAGELGVQQHVLRFWETKFNQVRPMKRGGGRRYYRPEDINLLRQIYHWLYVEGYTIKGVQKRLREEGKAAAKEAGEQLAEGGTKAESGAGDGAPEPANHSSVLLDAQQRQILEAMVSELKEIRAQVQHWENQVKSTS